MSESIEHIVIVGGGTSGWLAANHLGRALVGNKNISITLIESPNIPSIGVGEGTVPMMRETLKSFGISESTFIRDCDATFKQSVKFINWLDEKVHGKDHYYHHLFEYPFPGNMDMCSHWLNSDRSSSYADAVSFQGALCEQGLAPKIHGMSEYEGVVSYAYHLDAKKFSTLLSDNAINNFNVKHIVTDVVGVQLNKVGHIESLSTSDKGVLTFDFYVDCSGFKSYLLGDALDVEFIDKSDQLFIDSAIAVQVPMSSEQAIPPYTIATAHEAGWIWDITLTKRRGVGFAYASKYMDTEKAQHQLRCYLKGQTQDLNDNLQKDLQFRHIPMRVGYRRKPWEKNCVSVGLAQGFVEPLEATSILVSDFSARLLAERIPYAKSQLSTVEHIFNQRVIYAWGRVIDFIKLHYCISDRNDSDFWIDNRDPQTISPHLQNLLKYWQSFPPKASDFFSKFEVFDVENYLYVLYGMKYHTTAPALTPKYMKESGDVADKIKAYERNAKVQLPQHRELINLIHSHS